MMDRVEIWVCRWLIRRIRAGYGAACPDYAKHCASCEARDVIEWLENHIKLLQPEVSYTPDYER